MKNKRKRIENAFGTTEGPLGITMKDAHAVLLDALMKTQPAELRTAFSCDVDGHNVAGYCRKEFSPDDMEVKSHDDNSAENWDVSIITTSALDRDGEVVLASGGDFKAYMKSGGVVAFNHQHSELPVGRAAWVTRAKSDDPRKDGWSAKTLYHTKPKGWQGDWLPDAIFHMIQSGGMRGKSLGFLPLDGRRPEEKDLRLRPELTKAKLLITKWHVVEYSVAPVQANPDAMVTAVRKCFDAGLHFDVGLLEKMGLFIPGLVAAPAPEDDKPEPDDEPTYEQRFLRAKAGYTKTLKSADLTTVVRDEVLRYLGRY